MSVFQRFDGVWHFRYVWRGQVIRRSTKQGNKRAAEEMEAADRTARAKGNAGIGEKPVCPTLGHFLADRVRPWAAKQITTTATWYRSGINPLLTHGIKDRRLDVITTETITDYKAQREGEGRAVGTINRELRVLRKCLRLAAEWGIIAAAPKVKMAGAEVRRDRIVGEQEFASYLACASPLLADVAVVLNETGLRPDECHNLEWQYINFQNNSLFIPRGKTLAARRHLPLTKNVCAVFERRWQASDSPEVGYVFPSDTVSRHIDHSTLKKQHRAAIKKSGVRPFVIYALRHTFATKLGLAPGMDAWTLCKIMGWASIAIAATYIHPDQQRVLDVFGGQVFRKTRKRPKSGHVFGHVPKRRALKSGKEIAGTRMNKG